MGIEFAGKGIHNRSGQLFQVLGIYAGTDFLYQGDIRLVNVNDKVLILIREQVLHDVIGGDIRLSGNFNQHAHPAHVGAEPQFPSL